VNGKAKQIDQSAKRERVAVLMGKIPAELPFGGDDAPSSPNQLVDPFGDRRAS
jgi:hypothetical protein